MEKKVYEEAQINITLFDTLEVIVASGNPSIESSDADDLPIIPAG